MPLKLKHICNRKADSVKDGVIKAYERAIKNVNNDIEKNVQSYISTDIPEKEARRLMSIADSDKQYEELLELYNETDDKTSQKGNSKPHKCTGIRCEN